MKRISAPSFPQLLMREFCVLAAMSGVVTQRFIGPGLVFLACTLLFALYAIKTAEQQFLPVGSSQANDPQKLHPENRRWHSCCVFGFVLVFCAALGLAYAHWRAQTDAPPPEPPWLVALLAEHDAATPAYTASLHGRVERAEPLGSGAVRVFVRGLQPGSGSFPKHLLPEPETGLAPEEFFQPYSGLAMLSLYGLEGMAFPGQTVTGAVKLVRVRNFGNTGMFDLEQFWLDRGVSVRGWNASRSDVRLEGTGHPLAVLREAMRLRFLAALPQHTDGNNPFRSIAATLEEADEGLGTPDQTGMKQIFAPGFDHLFGTPQALLPALIFGDRDLLSPRQQELFQYATLSHSLSLSGLHLGYAVAVGLFMAGAVASLYPRILRSIPLPRLGLALALPLAVIYMWLGQAPVPLVRAGLMLFFATVLLFANRPRVLIDGLLAALVVILLYRPSAIFDLSLQLSALAMAVIAFWATPLLQASKLVFPDTNNSRQAAFLQDGRQKSGPVLWKNWRKPLRLALFTLLLSSTIQLALSPLIAKAFGSMSLWFPLNVLWLPVLGAVVMPCSFFGLALAALGLEAAASFFLALASWPCIWLLGLLEWMDAAGVLAPSAILRPTWITCAGFWLLCLALPPLLLRLCQRYRYRQRLAGQGVTQKLIPKLFAGEGVAPPLLLVLLASVMAVGPIIFGYYSYNTQPVSVRLLDVGQGQAVLVSWPGGRALVDGGGLGGGYNRRGSTQKNGLPEKKPEQENKPGHRPKRQVGQRTGGSGFDVGQRVIAPVLTDNRPARVDWLVATHPDFDHLSGLIYPLRSFDIRRGFASNGGKAMPLLQENLADALAARPDVPVAVWSASGQSGSAEAFGPSIIPLGPEENGLYFEVLWPLQGAVTPENASKDSNAHSLVLRLVWKGRGLVLLCGDVGKKAQNDLVRRYAKGRATGDMAGEEALPLGGLQADILVLPHHGAKSSLAPAFYDAVAPKLALAGCGYKNQWGFPSSVVREALAQRGIPLRTTAEEGQIILEWDANGEMRSGE